MRASRFGFVVLALVMVLSLVLSACGAAPTATPVPPTPVPPTATKAPAAAPTAAPAAPTAAPAAPTAAPAVATATKAPAPAATAAPAAATGTKILRRGQSGIQKFMDPFHISGGQIDEWMFLVLARLVVYDTTFGFQPDIATGYTVSADGKTYTFKLRQGVLWQDGTPFTSKDVVFTFNYVCQKDLNAAQYANQKRVVGCSDVYDGKATTVSGVKANGDFEVSFTLDSVYPLFMNSLTQIPIVPEAVVKDIKPADFTKSKFVTEKLYPGVGPFIVKEFKGDESAEFVANPKYFGGAPKIDGIRDIKIPDANTRLLALEKGEIDWAQGLPATELERIKKIAGVQLNYLDPVVANHLFINYHNGAKEADKPEQPKFKVMRDAKFRQALVYALDVPNLIKVADPTGQTDEWHCALSPSVGDQCAKDLAKYTYNPDKAKALLKEAGWDSSWELDFVSLNAPPPFYEIVQQLWAKVGVKANIRQVDIANFIAEFYGQGKFDLIISGQGRYIPLDNLNFLRCGMEYPKSYNSTQYCNKEVEALLDKALASPDPAVQKPLIQQVTKILDTDVPTYSLWITKSFVALGPKVNGATLKLGSGYNWGAPNLWEMK